MFTLGMEALYKIMEPGDSEKPLGVNKESDFIYLHGLHAAVSAAARSGCNMIVEHTIFESELGSRPDSSYISLQIQMFANILHDF